MDSAQKLTSPQGGFRVFLVRKERWIIGAKSGSSNQRKGEGPGWSEVRSKRSSLQKESEDVAFGAASRSVEIKRLGSWYGTA